MSRFLDINQTPLYPDLSNLSAIGYNNLIQSTAGLLLDENDKLKIGYLPNLSITDVYCVNDITERDNLIPSLQSGDTVKVITPSGTFMFDGVGFVNLNISTIAELSDVTTSSEINTNVLKWNNTAWTNQNLVFNDIDNINISNNNINNHLIKYDLATNKYIDFELNLNDNTNVNTVNDANNECLLYNSTTERYENKKINMETLEDINFSNLIDDDVVTYNLSTDKFINKQVYKSVLSSSGSMLYFNGGFHTQLNIGNENDVLSVNNLNVPIWKPLRFPTLFTVLDIAERDALTGLIDGDTVFLTQPDPQEVYIYTGVGFIQINGGGVAPPVNNIPTLTVPGAFSVENNLSYLFNNDVIVVGDPDNTDLEITITMSINANGDFTFSDIGLISSSGSTTQTVIMSGSITAINDSLNTLSFNPDTVGDTTINFSLSDGLDVVNDTVVATITTPVNNLNLYMYFDGKALTQPDNDPVLSWVSQSNAPVPPPPITWFDVSLSGVQTKSSGGGVISIPGSALRSRNASNTADISYYPNTLQNQTLFICYRDNRPSQISRYLFASNENTSTRYSLSWGGGNYSLICQNPSYQFNYGSGVANKPVIGVLTVLCYTFNSNGLNNKVYRKDDDIFITPLNENTSSGSTVYNTNNTLLLTHDPTLASRSFDGIFYGTELHDSVLSEVNILSRMTILHDYYNGVSTSYPLDDF